MAFDIERGVDLARLVALAAAGAREELASSVRRAQAASRSAEGRAYCNRIELEIDLKLLRLAGAMSREDDRRWHRWLGEHRERVIDFVLDRGDWVPAALVAAGTLLGRAVHPRSTWRAASAW